MTESTPASPPSAWVERFAPLIADGGTVLDLACGTGRHAALLTGLGHRVTALDRNVSRLAPDAAAEIVEADLEGGAPWPLPGRRFDGIVVTNYLHRPLFPELIEALSPDGALIYETFAAGNEKFGRPRNPDFLLRDGELLDIAAGELKVVAYEAGIDETSASGGPAVVQRIAAVRPEAGPVAIPLPA